MSVTANVFRTMLFEMLNQQLRQTYEQQILTILMADNFSDLMNSCLNLNGKQVTDEELNSQSQLTIGIKQYPNLKPNMSSAIHSFNKNLTAILQFQCQNKELNGTCEGNPEHIQLKHYWIQELFYIKALNYVMSEAKMLAENRKDKISELDAEIDYFKNEIEFAKEERIQMVREEVKQAEIRRLVKEVKESKRETETAIDTSQTMASRIDVMLRQCKYDEDVRARKLAFEDALGKKIALYDTKMINGQKCLDNLDLELKENDVILEKLKKKFEEIDVKFDEMTRTQKLKELLKNIEMADSFKRNRAARIIQAVWRRYKLMKYKRLKKKLRLRRKTGGGTGHAKRDTTGVGVGDKKDSSSEAGKGSSTRSGSAVPSLINMRNPPSSNSKLGKPSSTSAAIKKSKTRIYTKNDVEKSKK